MFAIVIPAEWQHWHEAQQRHWSDWFIGINTDTTPLLLLLIVLPYFWCIRRPFWTSASEKGTGPFSGRGTVIAVSIIAVTSLAVSWHVHSFSVDDRGEQRFGKLPPAYHDEFSYLFQSQTYLAGRLSFESHPTAAALFDQMHVVNEGRFASRYFPATGLFIAPWLWLGWPILGHWLAGAATCVLVFGIGRELSNHVTGFVAGMLTALSPGMALFGNLLLAHHPTLLGLFLFAWSFLRWMRRGFIRDAALAGIGLSWAMLCRPMTAAGFGLPFGIVFLMTLCIRARRGLPNTAVAPTDALSDRHQSQSTSSTAVETCDRIAGGGGLSAPIAVSTPRLRFRLLSLHFLAMTLPLLVGFIVLGIHNHAITGSVVKTPYESFNDIYTPRHGYGFNNVVRGEQHLGPRVLDNYDRWAVNLTPTLAIQNTFTRLIASWQWTLGLMPLLAGVIVFVVAGPAEDRRWWLIFAAIVSLFVVHVPYWFTGIFDWHYVFESGPLWCLLLAAATDRLHREWLAADRPRMIVWWGMFVASSVLVNHVDVPPLWYPSKLEAAVSQISFSRRKYQTFDEWLDREVTQRPALVLIEADSADRHIDYVINEPSLSNDVLRGRWPIAGWTIERVVATFPDRAIYWADVKAGDLRLIANGHSKTILPQGASDAR